MAKSLTRQPAVPAGGQSANSGKILSEGQAFVEQKSQAKLDRLIQAVITASETFDKKYGAKYHARPPEFDHMPTAPAERAKAGYLGFARPGVMVLRGSLDRYRRAEKAQQTPVRSSPAKKPLSLAMKIAPLPSVLRHPANLKERICRSTGSP